MKLKKVLSGVIAATMLATTTAIVMPISANAEDVELSTSEIAYEDLINYDSLTFTYTTDLQSDCGHSGHNAGETYCTWAGIPVLGKLKTQNVEVSDSKKTDWWQPTDTIVKVASGKDEATTSATVKVSAILNSFTTDSDWNESYELSCIFFQGWNATLTKIVGTPKSADAPVLKNVNETIDAAEISIEKNVWGDESQGQYNYQKAYGFDVTGYTNVSTLGDIDISTLTLKFKVADAKCGETAFDPSKISYQINVNGKDPDAASWNWNPKGSSSYNSTTNEVTVTADVEEIIGSNTNYEFLEFQLIAMIGASDTTDTVTLTIGEKADVAVSGVTLDNIELSLKKDETATIKATVAPADATDKTVTWTVAPEGVVSVKDGVVTALKSGTATITAKAGDKTATCKVTVTNPATAIAIDETASVLVGAEKALTVTTDPADADELTYTWTSSKPEVATVTNGVVTGVAAGEAVITVKAGALEASCTVTVTADTKPATAVTISKETLELEVEGTETLTATITPADSTDSVVWSTSNPEIATVANGKVTAVAEGSATITATAGDVMAECKVTVKAKPVEIETKAYELGIVDASGWGEDGVKQAAQTNQKVSITGITFGKSTYSDVKGKTLKLDGLAFGSCSADGVKAENVDVSLYAQFGDTWSWKSIGGKTLADGSIEWDMSTIEGVKDTDVIQEIGFQFNIKGNVGGINDMAATTKVILNAAEPKFTVVGEEPAEKSDYETGDVEKVKDYVPATTETGKKTELVVMSITEAEAARAESYTVTVRTSDGKEKSIVTNDCYKGFKYNTASGEKTETAANGYFIIVKVTGVPEGVTVNVTIEATK